MKQLVRFETEDHTTIEVEVDDEELGFERASRLDDLTVKAATTLDSAIERVGVAIASAVKKLREQVPDPDQLEVTFGIRLNAHLGAVIASAEGEGHLEVRLIWKHRD